MGKKIIRMGENEKNGRKLSFVQRYFALTLRRKINNSRYDNTGKLSSKDEIFWRLWKVLKPKNEAFTAFLALLDVTLPTCLIALQVSLKSVFFLKLCLQQPNKKHLLKNYDYWANLMVSVAWCFKGCWIVSPLWRSCRCQNAAGTSHKAPGMSTGECWVCWGAANGHYFSQELFSQ